MPLAHNYTCRPTDQVTTMQHSASPCGHEQCTAAPACMRSQLAGPMAMEASIAAERRAAVGFLLP